MLGCCGTPCANDAVLAFFRLGEGVKAAYVLVKQKERAQKGDCLVGLPESGRGSPTSDASHSGSTSSSSTSTSTRTSDGDRKGATGESKKHEKDTDTFPFKAFVGPRDGSSIAQSQPRSRPRSRFRAGDGVHKDKQKDVDEDEDRTTWIPIHDWGYPMDVFAPGADALRGSVMGTGRPNMEAVDAARCVLAPGSVSERARAGASGRKRRGSTGSSGRGEAGEASAWARLFSEDMGGLPPLGTDGGWAAASDSEPQFRDRTGDRLAAFMADVEEVGLLSPMSQEQRPVGTGSAPVEQYRPSTRPSAGAGAGASHAGAAVAYTSRNSSGEQTSLARGSAHSAYGSRRHMPPGPSRGSNPEPESGSHYSSAKSQLIEGSMGFVIHGVHSGSMKSTGSMRDVIAAVRDREG